MSLDNAFALIEGHPPIIYYAEDFLGSTRVMTTSVGAVCYDADFYPYGGEKVFTNTCAQNYKFEGKERDTETGNDDFGARYYSPVYGRWLSPDWSSVPAPVPYANLSNPQTLNLYAMVSDNPESFADLDGHEPYVNSSEFFIYLAKLPPPKPEQQNNQQTKRDDQKKDKDLAQEPKDKKTEPPPDQPSQASVGIVALPLIGRAVLGATEGAEAGGVAGTVEPGGGNVAGAIGGAIIGGAVAALAPTIYSQSKEALKKVGSQIERALDHVGKLNGPDQNPNPRGGWKQTIRDAANQIDKQAGRISNQNLSNAARFTAQLLRGLVD